MTLGNPTRCFICSCVSVILPALPASGVTGCKSASNTGTSAFGMLLNSVHATAYKIASETLLDVLLLLFLRKSFLSKP